MTLKPAQTELICTNRLFSDMPEMFVRDALDRMTVVRFDVGEAVLMERQSAHALGIIVSGEAAVYKAAGEGQVLMSILPAGSLLGAATLFMRDGGAATEVRAKRVCRVALLDEADVIELMRANFDFTLRYITYLTERVHFLTGRIESMGCTTAADKLYNFLLHRSVDGCVTLPLGMGELATALGISRASLYRALDDMEQSKRLRRDGKTIYIL